MSGKNSIINNYYQTQKIRGFTQLSVVILMKLKNFEKILLC